MRILSEDWEGPRSKRLVTKHGEKSALAKGLHDLAQSGRSLEIIFLRRFDLPDGVKDGGVVFAAKILSNLRQRETGQILAEVHGDLSWIGDAVGVVLRLELASEETESFSSVMKSFSTSFA